MDLILSKFGRHNDAPNFEDIMARRDHLTYRLSAASHNHNILIQSVNHSIQQYNLLPSGEFERIEAIVHAIDRTSFCFDDLVFNLASLLDYFGNYLGLLIYGPKCQTLKWSGFINKVNSETTETELFHIAKDENSKWFNRVLEFRGDVFHRKALKSEVKDYVHTYVFPQEVQVMEILGSSSLRKYFSILRDLDHPSLIECANLVAVRTLEGMARIINATETYKFDEKHLWVNNMK